MRKDNRLNLKQVSEAFGVSRVTIHDWLKKGWPSERTGKGYTFDLAACIQWRENFLQESKKYDGDAFEGMNLWDSILSRWMTSWPGG